MRKSYPATLDSLEQIALDAEAFCADAGADSASAFALNLCLEEVFANCATYGCGLDPKQKIEISLSARGGEIFAELSDSARAFDPLTQAPSPDLSADAESRPVGGLGIFLVKKHMDEVSYRREGDKNVLSMRRKIAAGGGGK